MRLLFISLGLGALLWYMLQHLPSGPDLVTLGGFIMVTAAIGLRLFEQFHIPGAAGALVVGVAIGRFHVLAPDYQTQMQPVSDFILAWVGLLVGTALTPSLLHNRRLWCCAGCLYLPPLVLAFPVLLFHQIPFASALEFAALSGMAAPLLIQPHEYPHSDTWPLAVLVTGLGMALWGVIFFFSQNAIWQTISFATGIRLITGLLGIEAFARIFRSVRTDSGRIIAWFLMALLVIMACWACDYSPLPLAFVLGLGLAVRAGNPLRFPANNPFSEMGIAFVITNLAVALSAPGLPHFNAVSFPILISLGGAVILGKLLGGGLARHLFSLPISTWLPLIPVGAISAVCFAHVAPRVWADPLVHVLVYLCGLGFLPLIILRPILALIHKIKNGRRPGKAPAQTTV